MLELLDRTSDVMYRGKMLNRVKTGSITNYEHEIQSLMNQLEAEEKLKQIRFAVRDIGIPIVGILSIAMTTYHLIVRRRESKL